MDGICPEGIACAIFQSILKYEFSEEGLEHISSLDHPVRFCRYGRGCRAHQRLLGGEMRLDDRCHCAVYFHSRADVAEENAAILKDGREDPGWTAFIFANLHISPTRADLQLSELVHEIRKNGYEEVLTTRDGERLVDIAARKRGIERYAQIVEKNKGLRCQIGGGDEVCAGPLTDAELLVTLLYTGTAIQGDLRKWIRNDDEFFTSRWVCTVRTLKLAVWKLQETPPDMCYHGLNGVLARQRKQFQYLNVLSLSMEFSIAKNFAQGCGGTVSDPSHVATVLCVNTKSFHEQEESRFRRIGIPPKSWYFADMRWLSKFPSEKEWIMVPFYTGISAFMDCQRLPAEDGVHLWLVVSNVIERGL